MTPSLVASYFVNSAGQNTNALSTSSFSPAVGEIIVVKCLSWDQGQPYSGAPTGGSLTYRSDANVSATTQCWGNIWTTTTTSTSSMSVSSSTTTANAMHSMCVERWSGAQLDATPATNSTKTGISTAPSATLTTVTSNSIVTWLNGDWNGGDPAGRAYRSSAVDEGVYYGATDNTQYYAYQDAASAGSQTIGMTVPSSQRWAMIGIEVRDAGGGAVAVPPPLVMAPPDW